MRHPRAHATRNSSVSAALGTGSSGPESRATVAGAATLVVLVLVCQATVGGLLVSRRSSSGHSRTLAACANERNAHQIHIDILYCSCDGHHGFGQLFVFVQ